MLLSSLSDHFSKVKQFFGLLEDFELLSNSRLPGTISTLLIEMIGADPVAKDQIFVDFVPLSPSTSAVTTSHERS